MGFQQSAFIRCAVACASAALVQACQRSDTASVSDTAPSRAETTAATSGATPAATAAATCGVDVTTVLTGDGIGDLRIGAPVDAVARMCRILRDTTAAGAEGLQERTIVVDLGRDSVTAVVTAGRVWRVHVGSPAFRTADSLGVGTPASALRRAGARVLTGEGKLFVALSSHCGLSFRLRGVEFGRVTSVAQLPPSAVVDEVLAIGCSAGRR
jgi:hypothetical protein